MGYITHFAEKGSLSLIPFCYTIDCSSKYENCHMLKYADDTVIIGHITNNNETQYMLEVKEFLNWCT